MGGMRFWAGLLLLLSVMGCTGTFSSPAEVRQQLVGKTVRYFVSGHGTQIEYYRDDGRLFLWYPGNSVVVPGEWRVRDSAWGDLRIGPHVCFRYGPNSYNPVTKTYGGIWECSSIGELNIDIQEKADGDIFGLSERRLVPFKLAPGMQTLQELLALAKNGT